MTVPLHEPSRAGRFPRPHDDAESADQTERPKLRKWAAALHPPLTREPAHQPVAGSEPPVPEPAPDQPIRFLLVCTANRCRSPMAESLLRSRLRAVEAPTLVSSAGTLAEAGLPPMPDALAVTDGLAEHTSRRVTAGLVDEADLVLCMTREHVRTIVMLAPDAFERTFTLKDLVKRAAASGPRRPGETIESWLAWVGRGRRIVDLVGYHDPDDVDDPIGLPAEAYRRCAADIDALLATIVALVFPTA